MNRRGTRFWPTAKLKLLMTNMTDIDWLLQWLHICCLNFDGFTSFPYHVHIISISFPHLGLSENSVPLHPMVLLIIIPTKWLFHWGYTQHFQTYPFLPWILQVIVESPEIPCCAMTIEPVVSRPLEKTTRGRLTGEPCKKICLMYITLYDNHDNILLYVHIIYR